MFLQMILGTIPRSIRAGMALVVMLVAIQQGFSDFSQLVLPGASKWKLVLGIFWLIVGLAAVVMFYYFQSVDGEGRGKKYNGLDTLSKAYESQRREKEMKSHVATPAFPNTEMESDQRDKRQDDHS
jgi:hypothetical protein